MDETRELDREAVIQRVWKRVMEGREGPIPEESQPRGSLQGEQAAPELLPSPAPRQQRDFPQGVVFLGEDSLDMAPLLQEMIRHELSDMRSYQALARAAGGSQARVFQGLANEEKTHAKRLSAAYFLISGVRYWPDGGKGPAPTSYLGALRQRFGEEQMGMSGYLAGAEATHDPCLRQLFLDLAKEEWEHACKIRGLVEQA